MSIRTRMSIGLLLALGATGAWGSVSGAQAEPSATTQGAPTKEVAAPAPAGKDAAAADTAANSTASPAPADTHVPMGFSAFSAESLGDGRDCVVGAVSDRDGLNPKPLVYLEDTNANRVMWVRPLDLPAGTTQGRATHCLRKGGTMYVLLQADTQPVDTVSRTLLRVIELDLAKGSVTANREIVMPGVTDAYSAWVDKGEEAFHLADKNGLAVQGEYFRMADPDKHLPFKVTLR